MKIYFILYILAFSLFASLASAEKEATADDEFADLLEGRAADKAKKATAAHLEKVEIDKSDYIKIRSKGDFYALSKYIEEQNNHQVFILSSEVQNEKKSYYALAVDQEIVNNLIDEIKIKQRGFLARFNFAAIKRNFAPFLATCGAFALVTAIVSPLILAPSYSYLTHYKYDGIKMDHSLFAFEGMNLGNNLFETARNGRLLEFQLEDKVENMAGLITYTAMHVAFGVANNLFGILAPPNSIWGSMKLGAFLGAGYYLGYSTWISKILSLVSGIIGIPNWIALKTMNRITSMNQKIDGFFYNRKYIPIKTQIKGE